VPLLELDNGERLGEGAAIVQYVADQAPGSKLAPPAGTMARYRLAE
jgi:glutathione S-transferase